MKNPTKFIFDKYESQPLPLEVEEYYDRFRDLIEEEKTIQFNQFLLTQIHNQIKDQFDQELQKYLIKNASELGYNFETEEDFKTFIIEKCTILRFQEKPHYHEIYIDYQDKDNKGILIGMYSNEVKITNTGSIILASVGGF
jgi:hypothetical protein